MNKEEIYAVIGNPILHSMSPVIFKAAFNAHKTSAPYLRLCGKSAEHALGFARRVGVCGFNVTSPFKEQMFALTDTQSEEAAKLKAVNTVRLIDGKVHGYNTDHAGVINMLEMGSVRAHGKRVVVIGAGGAAMSAVYALNSLGAKEVVVVNRTISKAVALSAAMNFVAASWDQLEAVVSTSDIVISCLPMSAMKDMSFLRDDRSLKIFDANYHSILSANDDQAKPITAGGREWLVGQGAMSFEILTGKEAPIGKMTAAFDAAHAQATAWNKIVLIGLPGSGKTTVGRALSSKLNCRFKDTDHMVVRSVGLTIPNIFERHNEAYFRKVETEAIGKAFSKDGGWVTAVGGGALKAKENRLAISNSGAVVVWLWSSPQSSALRIPPGTRPLFASEDHSEDLARLLNERRMNYAGSASLVVDTEDQTPDQICDTILFELATVRTD